MWKLTTPLVSCLLISGCGSCLEEYYDTPSLSSATSYSPQSVVGDSQNSISGLSIENDSVSIDRALPTLVTRFQGDVHFWINFESDGFVRGEPASLYVNGSKVASIVSDDTSGFRTTGKVNITEYLSEDDENIIEFHATVAGPPANLRASRMANASKLGHIAHVCHETDDFSKEIHEVFGPIQWSP